MLAARVGLGARRQRHQAARERGRAPRAARSHRQSSTAMCTPYAPRPRCQEQADDARVQLAPLARGPAGRETLPSAPTKRGPATETRRPGADDASGAVFRPSAKESTAMHAVPRPLSIALERLFAGAFSDERNPAQSHTYAQRCVKETRGLCNLLCCQPLLAFLSAFPRRPRLVRAPSTSDPNIYE